MKLYSEFARVYHDLYASLTDYAAEFQFYSQVLAENGCHKILELGCGTGLLAEHFVDGGFDYLGVDLSEEMLAIAQEMVPTGQFVRGDMRYFVEDYVDTFDAVLVPGNTFSHLTTNADVFSCLSSIRSILKPAGLLLFDALDSRVEFTNLVGDYEYDVEGQIANYHVASKYHPRFEQGWMYQWTAQYIIVEGNQKQSFEDEMLIRTFFQDELHLMLEMKEFEVLSQEFRELDSPFINWVARKAA